MRHGAAGCLVLGAILLQAVSPSDVGAQAVRGRLRDMAAGTPIVLGQVTLVDSAGQPVRITITDSEGRFFLAAPEPGQYWIKPQSPFHEGYTDGPIPLAEGDTVSLIYELQPLPVELDELTVEGDRRSPKLAMEGVYDRSEAGIGVQIGRERIQARKNGMVSELVALLPMVELFPDTLFGGVRVLFRRRQFQRLIDGDGKRPPPCYPQVFLNGVVLAPGGNVPAELDRFPLAHLEAVEVYESPAGLPTRFSGQFAHCGTIVLWTG